MSSFQDFFQIYRRNFSSASPQRIKLSYEATEGDINKGECNRILHIDSRRLTLLALSVYNRPQRRRRATAPSGKAHHGAPQTPLDTFAEALGSTITDIPFSRVLELYDATNGNLEAGKVSFCYLA